MPKRSSSKKTISLNEEQKVAVEAGRGVWACIAGPGAGKSTALVARYVHLVDNGVDPDQILSLTFTNEAAKGMRKKAEDYGAKEKSGERVAGFLTFHSLALAFAIEERENFPFKLAPFPLATEAQTGKCISESARRYEIDPKLLRSYISLQKRTQISPQEAIKAAENIGEGEKSALAYGAYDKALRGLGVLDFDSLLVEMVALLAKRKDITARWQYEYVMTDESQDHDSLQFSVLKLLTEEHGNLFCVGDFGQSVYSFRGADGKMFLDLADHFPGAKTLYLARNHRSTQRLVAWQKVIHPVRELAEKFESVGEEGTEPEILSFASSFEEATEVARRIKDGVVQNPDSHMILSRTNRALRVVEDSLSVAGIRYRVANRTGFYNQGEVRSLLSLLQCSSAPYDSAVLGAIRSPFEPTKFLRKKELADHLLAEQKLYDTKPSLFSLLMNHQPETSQAKAVNAFRGFLHTLPKYKSVGAAEAVKALIRDTRATDYYADGDGPVADNNPNDNLGELVKAAARFGTVPEFLEHIRKVEGASRSKKGVLLSSCHAAKGSESDSVHLIQCAEGVLPHSRAESLEEEERVFFVAISRPRFHLTISYSGQASRFLGPFLPKVEDKQDEFFG